MNLFFFLLLNSPSSALRQPQACTSIPSFCLTSQALSLELHTHRHTCAHAHTHRSSGTQPHPDHLKRRNMVIPAPSLSPAPCPLNPCVLCSFPQKHLCLIPAGLRLSWRVLVEKSGPEDFALKRPQMKVLQRRRGFIPSPAYPSLPWG